MKKFMDKDFLLENKTAKKLYHNYAEAMPIYDYHCHINVEDVANDKVYKTITELWLLGDHYKWRALRTIGVSEEYITGNKPDYEKFFMWAKTIPYTIGNPLYHWTHMELKKYFGITKQLNEKNAKAIYDICNEQLKNLSARKIITASNVRAICTTDDPIDALEHHKKIKQDKEFNVNVMPTFRPDKAINIEQERFYDWLERLEATGETKITCLIEYEHVLTKRLEYFHNVGCRISDLDFGSIKYCKADNEEVDNIFDRVINKTEIDDEELNKFKTHMMLFFGREYAKRGWIMQYHIGALRNNSRRKMEHIGPDTGFDSIADENFADTLSKILDELDYSDELPKTILYCLNPRDNEVLATMIGNFQGDGIRGKLQFGSGWWFNDQKDGINCQLEALGQLGLISTFIGMLTDSRSLLSYVRHDYFRRILCNKFGCLIENGEYHNDIKLVGEIVQDICYNNIERYFEV